MAFISAPKKGDEHPSVVPPRKPKPGEVTYGAGTTATYRGETEEPDRGTQRS